MASRYRTSAHARYTIFYHIVFCPKYRRKIFENVDVDQAIKEALRGLAQHHDWVIVELETDQDHIHVFLSAPPSYSPAQIVKLIKTWTYSNVYDRFPAIKKYLWGGHLWAVGFYVSTVSDRTTKEEIARYVRDQKRKERSLARQQRLF